MERSLDNGLHKTAPDYLKQLINEEAQEPDYVISTIENISEYVDVFLEKWNFEYRSFKLSRIIHIVFTQMDPAVNGIMFLIP